MVSGGGGRRDVVGRGGRRHVVGRGRGGEEGERRKGDQQPDPNIRGVEVLGYQYKIYGDYMTTYMSALQQ